MISTRDRLEAILAGPATRADNKVFLKLYPEVARAEAEAADRRARAGINLGPLDGKIVSIKDLLDVAGEPTTAGSAILRNATPAVADAVVVRRLRQAGAVILGKTNMSEFAFDMLGRNPHYGMPPNATDATRIPGGSSSGAAVSVAMGSSDIAIGSDTGGSVRVPASLNGVVGFKPTAGRVPLEGAYPLSFTLDSIGPLACSVAECRAADAVMAGQEAQLLTMPLSGLRIGLPRGFLLDELEPVVAQAYERSVRHLEAFGARVLDHEIDDLVTRMREATKHGSIPSFEGAAVHADWLGTETAAAVDPNVSVPFTRRLSVPEHIYIRMMQWRSELVSVMNERLFAVDVLALPTTPTTAPLTAPLLADAELADRTELLLFRNTQIANQFGLTAISLPMPAMTVPAGLMLIASGGDDQRLLAIAVAVDEQLQRLN
jgi:aspartyl-tRNA(Asn)/glutamyl-tRNA(Gln) amidotransferase subunit A